MMIYNNGKTLDLYILYTKINLNWYVKVNVKLYIVHNDKA